MIAARAAATFKAWPDPNVFDAKRPAGGRERGAPVGAQVVSRDERFSTEHPLGLFADGPRTSAFALGELQSALKRYDAVPGETSPCCED